jgi:hypothetical protein
MDPSFIILPEVSSRASFWNAFFNQKQDDGKCPTCVSLVVHHAIYMLGHLEEIYIAVFYMKFIVQVEYMFVVQKLSNPKCSLFI